MNIPANKTFIEWFREAAPYIHSHRGKTFVIQIDADLVASDDLESFIHDLSIMSSLGIRLVLVYGARHQIQEAMKEQKQTSIFMDGLRVTDAETIEIVKKTVGTMRFEMEALFSMGLPNSPMAAARIKVSSGNFIMAKPLGVIDGVDMQYTGQVRKIDSDAIRSKLDNSEIVLIPSVGYSLTGALFNLSANSVAAHVATSLSADKLIFALPFAGIKSDNGEEIKQLTQAEVNELLDGMSESNDSVSQLLRYSSEVLAHSVERVHILDSRINGCLLTELFQRDGSGMMISHTAFDCIRKAQISDISGMLELIHPLENQGILVPRSREKLETEIGDYTLFLRDETVVACAALHFYPEHSIAELACLVVHGDYRHSGKGEELFLTMQKEAQDSGMKDIFVLTTQAEHWFIEQGFIETSLDDLPLEKQQMINLSRNSKVLIKSL